MVKYNVVSNIIYDHIEMSLKQGNDKDTILEDINKILSKHDNTKIVLDDLILKAEQFEQEQKFKYETFNNEHDKDVLKGISRIVKLIKRIHKIST